MEYSWTTRYKSRYKLKKKKERVGKLRVLMRLYREVKDSLFTEFTWLKKCRKK